MPVYLYNAKNNEGNVIKGTLEAIDEKSVMEILRKKDYFPVSIKPYKEFMNIDLSRYQRISIKDISIFCRQFSVTITAGVPMLKTLNIIKEQTENKKLKGIINSVHEEVQRGKALSEAFAQYKDMPQMLINMINVGESSGTLDKVMIKMAEYYDKEYKQRQKIKTALTYPAIVAAFSIIVVTVLVVKILPSLIMNIGTQELPTPTKILLAISKTVNQYGIIIIIAIFALVMIIKRTTKSGVGKEKLDKFKITVPIFGKIIKKIITARFARTFGLLMASGVPLLQSLDICQGVAGNTIIAEALYDTKEEIKRGRSIAEVLEEKKLFPTMLTQMMKIGEETGTLDSILEKTAEYYDSEVESSTMRLTSMIEPAIIIFLAVVVAFIILSVILPIFSSYDAMAA